MKTRNLAFVVALVLALGSHTVRSATIVWTNAASGNWNGTANWKPNQVPGGADNAVITNSGTYTVTLNVSASVASLTLGGTSGTQSFARSDSQHQRATRPGALCTDGDDEHLGISHEHESADPMADKSADHHDKSTAYH